MHPTTTSITDYYARRALEYERVYQRPERQNDLRDLEQVTAEAFPGLQVLEVACGTGYWTQFAAQSAASIFAVDYNSEVLRLAQQKDYGSCPVRFIQADAYSLQGVDSVYSAGLATFWWSHVPKQRLSHFLGAFHSRLKDGAPVLVIDNAYVEGNSTPISRTDDEDNTYQIRKLSDGSTHEIVKNFPDAAEFERSLERFGTDATFSRLSYYWIGRYRVNKNPVQSRAP